MTHLFLNVDLDGDITNGEEMKGVNVLVLEVAVYGYRSTVVDGELWEYDYSSYSTMSHDDYERIAYTLPFIYVRPFADGVDGEYTLLETPQLPRELYMDCWSPDATSCPYLYSTATAQAAPTATVKAVELLDKETGQSRGSPWFMVKDGCGKNKVPYDRSFDR